jgi:hypothetical protein
LYKKLTITGNINNSTYFSQTAERRPFFCLILIFVRKCLFDAAIMAFAIYSGEISPFDAIKN